MFTKISKLKLHHQTMFALVIAFSVVCFWRGIWGLLDKYLLPNNYGLSHGISLLLGMGILVATHYVASAMH